MMLLAPIWHAVQQLIRLFDNQVGTLWVGKAISHQENEQRLGMVIHSFNHYTGEAETQTDLLDLEAARSTGEVLSQPELRKNQQK